MSIVDILTVDCEAFAIYGAQVVAYGAYKAIKHLCGRVPECFLVTTLEGNLCDIEGIPVRTPDGLSKDTLILVCVTELLQGEILRFLKEQGFQNTFVLTQHEEHLLMSAYFQSAGKFSTTCRTSDSNSDFGLYEVRNHRDKPLSNPPELHSYEFSIQAGTALTDTRIALLGDNTGMNISDKNKQYCEMSATYWVWKNTTHQWKGIEHYRRHLLVKPEMLSDDVDAFLPLPYLCYPNTIHQFRRFVSEDVLQALLISLKHLHPEEHEDYYKILCGQYQYTYNLVCARKDVFDAYCKWFFRITEHMETLADKVPELGNTRALSYVAEVLTNLYFMHNQQRLKICHVEKAVYV